MLIATAKDAAALLVPLFRGCRGEKVVVAHHDADLKLIETREEKNGSHDRVELPIRSIIEEALRLRSEGLIVAHNHPSGDRPCGDPGACGHRGQSRIQLHDHLIVGADGDCRSLKALGLL